MATLETALAIAAQGFPVFPCGKNKRPAISKDDDGHGFHDATLDVGRIRELFARAPHAVLVGAPTGEITGFDVLDIDPRHGGDKWEAEQLARLPETRIHQTPGGGRHYLFRHAPGVRNSSGHFREDGSVGGVALGVDVRGDGGYVILPPCEGYRVVHDAEIAEWPDWLLDILLREPEPPAVRVNGFRPSVEIESRRLDGFTKSVLDRVRRAAEGSKHFVLRNAALSLGGIAAAAGLSDDEATQLLLQSLPTTVKDWNNAAQTIKWGLERGRNRPIELEERRLSRPQSSPPEDLGEGWWASLEQHLLDGPAEVQDYGDEPPPTSANPDKPPDLDNGGIIDPRKWTAPAPLRQWIVQDWIPRGYVTGLYGDGGIGKSLLAQQLLTSVASASQWLGMDVRAGPAFGFMCEDDVDELHRRQESINRGYRLPMSSLELLRYASRVGFDNLLMTFNERNQGLPTPLFTEVINFLTKFRPALVVIDTVADTFGGDEIKRAHARQFVQGVGGNIARAFDCAVLFAAHPSAAGISQGTGTGGSTAWSNTFRSRLYLTADKDNPDQRQLSRMKANYAPTKAELILEWRDGCFVERGAPEIVSADDITWAILQAIFAEITRAWDAGEPWSARPQTRNHGRYLPLWVFTTYGIEERMAASVIQKWMANGHIKEKPFDPKTKLMGLKVMKALQPPVGGRYGGGPN